jgi:uncharacterized protein (DUF362 family)
MAEVDRRGFLVAGAGAAAAWLVPRGLAAVGRTATAGGGGPGAVVHAVTGARLGDLPAMAREAVRSLGLVPGALAGRTVFVKPNFGSLGTEAAGRGFDPASGEVTKPEIVAAVAQACLEAGAAQVSIGDGARACAWDWAQVAFLPGNVVAGARDLAGAVAALQARFGASRVELVCLNQRDEWDPVPASTPDASVSGGLMVARALCRADHVISLPVLKTHRWVLLTAALNNCLGALSSRAHGDGRSRRGLHQAYAQATCHGEARAGVAAACVDLLAWRRANGFSDFAILDASIGLEGDGPHAPPINDGRTVHLNARNRAGRYALLASRDWVALDSLAARLINLAPAQVKSLRMARHAGLGDWAHARLEGAALEELMVADWARPGG